MSRVIVEMVARQVGEGRRGEREPVEAELVEAVARCLERDVIDAGARQRLQRAVERHRVGRRQAAGLGEIGADDAERAEARRAPAVALPDLAGEGRDRGLAVGAGDGGDGGGLGRVEARRHQREAAARVGVGDHPHRRRAGLQRGEGGGVGDQHGGSALGHGLVDEAGAVGAAAGKGREEKAGLNRARIRGEAGDLRIAARDRRRRRRCRRP